LKTETKKIPFGKPLIDEQEKMAVEKVLSGPILVHGPQSEEFESSFADFTQAPHAVSVSSCTAGMHLIYHALGFGSGDEVIVPAQTHVATAHAVELTGAKPIFVDSELTTGNIDIPSIEASISTKTRAIAVVHYLGVPVNMDQVNKIAKKYSLFVLEDCALSPGASFKGTHTGLLGDAGCFSFYPVKHITTAEGGMVILKDKVLADKIRLLKAFGVNRTHGERKIPGEYDVTSLGYNYRMSEVHAAIGIEQIKKLPTFLKKRQKNFECLNEQLEHHPHLDILVQPVDSVQKSSHYCMGVLLSPQFSSRRPEIMNKLQEVGIGTSIYYPHPVPSMSYYIEKYGEIKCPNAEAISNQILALPVGPHLHPEDMVRIAEELIKIVNNYITIND
jgi:dTDP-4-amino-4,6-dideoxygalactose transaminase|tara:strand:- start:9063 stop:10229 length:1167 start_codon:yes stop_codon:yes gene_type:complete